MPQDKACRASTTRPLLDLTVAPATEMEFAASPRFVAAEASDSDVSSEDSESSGDESAEEEWDASSFLGTAASHVATPVPCLCVPGTARSLRFPHFAQVPPKRKSPWLRHTNAALWQRLSHSSTQTVLTMAGRVVSQISPGKSMCIACTITSSSCGIVLAPNHFTSCSTKCEVKFRQIRHMFR